MEKKKNVADKKIGKKEFYLELWHKFLKAIWNPEKKSRLLPIVSLSLLLPAIIYIIAPFEIYCNNIAELNFSATDFLGIECLFALRLALQLFIVLFFVPQVVYRFLYPAIVGFLLMMFIQTNFLNGSITSLAGDDMEGATPVWTYIWNTAVWLLVIAGVIVAFQFVKIKKISQLVAIIVTVAIGASQLMNFAVASLVTEGAYDTAIERVYGKYDENPRFVTNKDIEALGRNRNVVMFCIDRFDATLYAEPAMKKYPKAFECLDGFTYYEDAISLYGNTFPAVGYMMSGIEYGNDNHAKYFNQVYHENQTLSVLKEQGYSIHLFNEAYYDYTNANELPSYVENTVETTMDTIKMQIRKPRTFVKALTNMSLFRCLPFLLKDCVANVDSNTCNEYVLYNSDDLGEYHSFSYDLKNAYNDIKDHDGNFKTKGEKNFSFIHVSGCHTADYDENWGKTKKKDYIVSAKNSMEMVGLYIKNMKELSPQLYHDSTIIILGDHGKVESRTKKFKDSMLTALFIKPAGVSGTEMKTSPAPVSHENLWATIFESEGLSYDQTAWKPSVFTIEREFEETGVYPERKFIWNKRRSDLNCYDSIVYKINGKARNFKNWSIESETYYDHPLFAN